MVEERLGGGGVLEVRASFTQGVSIMRILQIRGMYVLGLLGYFKALHGICGLPSYLRTCLYVPMNILAHT